MGVCVRAVMSGRRLASLVVAVLVAAGCNPSEEPEAAGPSGGLPADVTPAADVGEAIAAPDSGGSGTIGSGETPPGTLLDFGEPAVIAIESGGRSGVVEATVDEISPGETEDLEGLGLGDQVAGQVPYYVRISLKNVSEAEMPFTSLDNDFHGKLQDGTPASEVGTIDGFGTCESTPAPADFFEGKSFETCRIFVASEGTRVNAVAYEGFESPYAEDPIVWR